MNINRDKIHSYVQAYGDTLSKLRIAVTEQDKLNIVQLIVLLGELDDLYDKSNFDSREQTLPTLKQAIKGKMTELIPDGPLRVETIDSLFNSMEIEARGNIGDSLEKYLAISSITSGVQLVACYLGSLIKIVPNIWFSRLVDRFGREIGAIVRLANDYLDLGTSKTRMLTETAQINAAHFFHSKRALKYFIAYKYVIHKLKYYFCIAGFSLFSFVDHCQHYLQALNCYESVLDLGFQAYFVDQEACRD